MRPPGPRLLPCDGLHATIGFEIRPFDTPHFARLLRDRVCGG
ncbi:MAG: hypothetical protein NZM15_07700 [Flavobacteriales bacterium]|nr:hypothetical protein [Flavobacteriales bacterium]MDW8432570.1 hypothetical protein [Flavobacteriales bacterium]